MKKNVAPIIAAGIVVLYLLVYIFLIVTWVESIWLKVLLSIVTIWLIYTTLKMLAERLDEIKRGEDDDIGNY